VLTMSEHFLTVLMVRLKFIWSVDLRHCKHEGKIHFSVELQVTWDTRVWTMWNVTHCNWMHHFVHCIPFGFKPYIFSPPPDFPTVFLHCVTSHGLAHLVLVLGSFSVTCELHWFIYVLVTLLCCTWCWWQLAILWW
jgi:hypothetical protein